MPSTVKLLSELVEINSVNPSLSDAGDGEGKLASAVAEHLRASHLDVVVTEVAPGRQNVVGVLEGSENGHSLMLCGHMDTVGVEGMVQPFNPLIRDGRLYGRGSGDMKGGLAAILDAARQLSTAGWSKGKLIVAAVIDEEYTSIGAEALVKEWSADGAVITEPTSLAVAVGHKGFSWVEIVVEGRAAHGSRPKEGRDAILMMGKVLQKLDQLTKKLQSTAPHHLLGCASLHASLINGGREMSTYPDNCVLKIERRTITGEDQDVALREIDEILDQLKIEDTQFRATAQLLFDRSPYETPAHSTLPEKVETSLRGLGRSTRREGMTYWTDAAILGSAGIPSVIFGPGGEGFHGLEEFVVIDDVLACRDVLVNLSRDFCSEE